MASRRSAHRRRRARALVIGLAVALLGAAASLAAPAGTLVIDDWSGQTAGHRGIPQGWVGQNWGSPKHEFEIVLDDGQKVLRMRSDGDSSTITKEVKVDVKEYPILQWRWKAVLLPRGGDARRKETDDQAAQLYVTFPRFPRQLRSRIIGYIWDATAPAGSIFGSQKVSMVTFVVVRSGEADLGKWLTETRNVREDYRRIYGEEPGERIEGISLTINSQNTGTRAEAYFGEILFRRSN
jgi:hypothetical protein